MPTPPAVTMTPPAVASTTSTPAGPTTTTTTTHNKPTVPEVSSPSLPVTVLTMPTPPAVTMTPPAVASTTSTPAGPPTTTTTTQVPLTPGSLLCTIGQGFDKSTYTFPPDGLCTIIIFDSLYRKGASLAPPYPQDFEYFLETAKKAQQTEFGIGIHQK
ncbi:hypothetical protein MTO96_037242 [Rhipicephalus appendiculatus]